MGKCFTQVARQVKDRKGFNAETTRAVRLKCFGIFDFIFVHVKIPSLWRWEFQDSTSPSSLRFSTTASLLWELSFSLESWP